MSFENDLIKDKRREPLKNKIYRQVFGDDIGITRFADEKNKKFLLDKEYHIDVEIRLPIGNVLTGQEKVLSHKYLEFNTFTIEYYQNRFIKENGEFFNIASQFYFVGYLNREETDFDIYAIVKLFDFFVWLNQYPEYIEVKSTTKSRASFFFVNLNLLPDNLFFAKWQKKNKALPKTTVANRIANMRQGERTDIQPSANLPKINQDYHTL